MELVYILLAVALYVFIGLFFARIGDNLWGVDDPTPLFILWPLGVFVLIAVGIAMLFIKFADVVCGWIK